MRKQKLIDGFLCILVAGALTGLVQPKIMESIENKQELNKTVLEQLTVQTRSSLKGSAEVIKSSTIEFPTEGRSYAVIHNDEREFSKELYFGDSEDILDIAIGQYSKTGVLPGMGKPLLIAGHNGTHFYKLPSFENGDQIKIDTAYGEFVYEMYDSEIIYAKDFDASVLDEEEERLIIYTCYPFDIVETDQRYFVYAKKIAGPVIMEDGSWKE